MKLFICQHCENFMCLKRADEFAVTFCECGKSAGKYLSDKNTAVFSKDCIIVGIDNNSFNNAVDSYVKYHKKFANRVDFFFTGWIPTKPGEVIIVNDVYDVCDYPYIVEVPNVVSTMPVSMENVQVVEPILSDVQ
jgi:hypothetical protein